MESPPFPMPAPAIVEGRGKSVVVHPPEVSSAYDYALIGYIITLLLSIPWLLTALVIGGIGVAAYLGYTILPPVLPAYIIDIPFLGSLIAFIVLTMTPSFILYIGLGAGALLVAIIFLGSIYFGIVRNISKGRYEKARNAALFWAVLFIIPTFFVVVSTLLTGTIVAIVPAFFFMMTYGRLGEVIAKYGPVAVMGEAVPGMQGVAPPPMPGPPGVMPMGMPVPAGPMVGGPMPPQMGPGPASPRPNPQCPTCGKELYYSANHRRWYCQNCDNPSGHR